MTKSIGILLTNTGTPDSPSVSDVKAYLKTFLSDRRVVRLPPLLWKPLLYTVILPRRAPYSAELYQKIWTEEGSPLRTTMLALTKNLQKQLTQQFEQPVYIETGMHYGNPSIPEALEKLRAQAIEELLVLPLFPQYSTSTTETTKDQIEKNLKKIAGLKFSLIPHYASDPAYIEALVNQIKKSYKKDHHLLFSFHGLPQFFADQGDPYPELCQQTTRLVAEALELEEGSWTLTYQSRFGYAKWLTPYTNETLAALPQKGIRQLCVVCPGFSVDCLETLEEIQIRGKEIFLKEGGESFHYIPALNATESHVQALRGIIQKNCSIKIR
jgi:ferrochelatase